MQGIGIISGNRWLPLILTSLAFGLMHYANPEIAKFGNVVYVFYIGSGLFAGIMTLMDDGLELAIGFHASNNLIVVLLLTADWTVFQTESILIDISEPSLGLSDWLAPLIVYPIIITILSRKYSWTNWKKKLFSKVR